MTTPAFDIAELRRRLVTGWKPEMSVSIRVGTLAALLDSFEELLALEHKVERLRFETAELRKQGEKMLASSLASAELVTDTDSDVVEREITTKCTTCGWPKPSLCVCADGDRHWDKLVTSAQKTQLARIKAQVDIVWPGAGMSVSYLPYSARGEPGPMVCVGFSSHDRISLYGHSHVLDALEALLAVYVAHPIDRERWEQEPAP